MVETYEDAQGAPAPTVQHLLEQTTLKWVFVGGKARARASEASPPPP